MIVNFYYGDYARTNLAESLTQPIDYFGFGEPAEKVTISLAAAESIDSSVSMVIVGGSGILRVAWDVLRLLSDRLAPHIPIVVWGMGINTHGRYDKHYDETLEYVAARENTLIGMRDHFYKSYVPCASCMRPEFDCKFSIKHEIGFYSHHSLKTKLSYPTMSNGIVGNRITYFWRVLQFLGSCEIVVTNTYHGAYWATLLNRKVVVVEPFSNKFFGFKYEPIIVDKTSAIQRALRVARNYPMALNESRRENEAFFMRVVAFRQMLAAKQTRAKSRMG